MFFGAMSLLFRMKRQCTCSLLTNIRNRPSPINSDARHKNVKGGNIIFRYSYILLLIDGATNIINVNFQFIQEIVNTIRLIKQLIKLQILLIIIRSEGIIRLRKKNTK